MGVLCGCRGSWRIGVKARTDSVGLDESRTKSEKQQYKEPYRQSNTNGEGVDGARRALPVLE